MPPPNAIYGRTLWPIAAGCVLTPLLLSCIRGFNWMHVLLEGVVLGTVFSQAVLAAAWAALGPGKFQFRVPLSLAWATMLGTSLALGVLIIGQRHDIVIFVIATVALWLAAQVPLWGTALFFGLRLWHQGTMPTAAEQRQVQFGIGQLMSFTALIAVLLGAGRLVLSSGLFTDRDELAFWGFAIVSQIVTNLPLIFAVFLPRHCGKGIAVSLLLIGSLTVLQSFYPPAMLVLGPPAYFVSLFIATNSVSVIWVLIFATVIRYSGYHFGRPEPVSADSPLPGAILS